MVFYRFFILVGWALIAGAQVTDPASSGSGSASGSGAPTPFIYQCTELPLEHPCLGLANRGSNYTLPQSLPAVADIDDFAIRVGFAIITTMRNEFPSACVDVVEYYLCMLGSPPCDPNAGGRPMLICDKDCEAYTALERDDVCDDTKAYTESFAMDARNFAILRVLEVFNKFDCTNVSTYYFFERDGYSDMCTGILSDESRDAILNNTSTGQCVPIMSSACSAIIYPEPYYIPVSDRDEVEVFSLITANTAKLNHICADALVIFGCLFIHPPCNPEKGTQLPSCENSCQVLDDISAKCHSQFLQIEGDPSDEFLNFLLNYNCSNVLNYVIPGIPVDTDMCIDAADYFDILSESSSSSISTATIVAAVIGSVTVLIILLLGILLIAFMYQKTKMKRYYRQWAYSVEQRSATRVRRAEQIVELTGARNNSKVFDTPPDDTTFENSVKFGGDYVETGEVVKLSAADIKRYESQFSQSVVHYTHLQTNECIGEGAFGKVYSGILNNPANEMVDMRVAVKTIKNIGSEEQLSAFLAESLIMKDFQHPHILGLVGVCFDAPDGSPYIVLPFMANGSVKTYLRQKRVHVLDVESMPEGMSLEVLVQMCIDIAEGMKYLAENKFVHRDLAARNCMLNNSLSVMVGDFGLARDVYNSEYYRAGKGARLPVKWMPPETLHDGISNEKTDVWSYGVTCWEVFSLGRTPYPGIENHEIMDYISGGGRLKKPALCPDKLYKTVSVCWQYLPEERPTFEEILSSLKDYWDEEHFYILQSFASLS